MERIIVYTDGGSRGNPGPAAVGVVIQNADGETLATVAQSIGNATNNFAEYQAVVTALESLKKMYGKKTKEMTFEIRMDSELVKKQLNHEYQIKEPGLVPFFMAIHNMRVANFPHITLTHVVREKNKEADALVNKALDALVKRH